MSTENVWLFAAREKIRFNYKGQISAEDLWDLSITKLDELYRKLATEKKNQPEEAGLINKEPKDTKILNAKMALVTEVFTVKKAEADAKEEERKKKAIKQKIMEIREEKQYDDLRNKSIEELDTLINQY